MFSKYNYIFCPLLYGIQFKVWYRVTGLFFHFSLNCIYESINKNGFILIHLLLNVQSYGERKIELLLSYIGTLYKYSYIKSHESKICRVDMVFIRCGFF